AIVFSLSSFGSNFGTLASVCSFFVIVVLWCVVRYFVMDFLAVRGLGSFFLKCLVFFGSVISFDLFLGNW
ncbi:hypothetical protein, partial [Rhizobium brockwellii]|uniref:hypothetical protein n=1 Tax=Rhizobium brockwellii TaxID=3019932 RepID=UPI003F99DF89